MTLGSDQQAEQSGLFRNWFAIPFSWVTKAAPLEMQVCFIPGKPSSVIRLGQNTDSTKKKPKKGRQKPKPSPKPKPKPNANSNQSALPAAKLIEDPPAGATGAVLAKKLEDSESDLSYDRDTIAGGTALDKNPNGSMNDIPALKSEDAVIQELLDRLPGFSDSGKTKIMQALFVKQHKSGAADFATSAFEQLHNTIHCRRQAENQTAAKRFEKERNDLQGRLGKLTGNWNDLAARYKSTNSALTQANSTLAQVNFVLAQVKSALNQANFALQTEKNRSQAIQERAQRDVQELQKQIEDLRNLHVRSVNAIAPGIEPISDQTLSKRLLDHHTKTYQWCRRNFGTGGRKLDETYGKLPPNLLERLDAQCDERNITSLPLSRAADLLLWNVLHVYVIAPWFPVNIPCASNYNWEDIQRSFGHIDAPEHQERVEFWRAYTASLAFQSPDFELAIDHAAGNLTAELVTFLGALFDPIVPESHQVDVTKLHQIIREIFITAAEMRCQRGYYDLELINLGTEFNEDTMDNAEKAADIDDTVIHVVRVVLSDGIVKRPFRGSKEEIGRVWMPRVFVGEAEYKVGEVAQDSHEKILGDREEAENAGQAGDAEPEDVQMG